LKRHALSKKDRESLKKELKEKLGISSIPDNVEIAEDDERKCYIFDGAPAICEVEGNLIPLIKWMLKERDAWSEIPRIVVNRGAVKPISSGANLMAPGIVSIEGSFSKGSVVVVVEEERKIPIAVMKALYSSDEVKEMKRGKVAENLHHIGDKLFSAPL